MIKPTIRSGDTKYKTEYGRLLRNSLSGTIFINAL
jgi:hypothetical protein